MQAHTSPRPAIANRPIRWALIGAIVLAPLAACVSSDGNLAPRECEEPPPVPVDTTLPDSARPEPPSVPAPGAPVCDPDDV